MEGVWGKVRRGRRRAAQRQPRGNKTTAGSAVCRLLDTFDKDLMGVSALQHSAIPSPARRFDEHVVRPRNAPPLRSLASHAQAAQRHARQEAAGAVGQCPAEAEATTQRDGESRRTAQHQTATRRVGNEGQVT